MDHDKTHTSADEADDHAEAGDPLVAYLDGELDDGNREALERRVADDEALRRRMTQLERAWTMLDLLPKAEVGDSFTRSTVELVALAAESEIHEQEAKRRTRAWRGLLTAIAALVAVAGIGFAVAFWLIPTENDRLVRDLAMIEQLDAYLVGETVDFAQQLVQADLFQGGEEESFAWDETLPQRSSRIELMSATERETLRRKQERFSKLDREQQQSIRDLNAALEARADRDRLLATLVAYRNWRSDLSPEERAALAQLEPAQRVAKIRSIQTEQEKRSLARAAKELSPEDARIIRHWLEDYARSHADELKERFSQRERDMFDRAKDEMGQEHVVRGRLFREVFESRKFPTSDADQIKRFVESLSKEARAKWATATTTELQNTLLVEWVGTAVMLGWRGPGRYRAPGPIDPDEVRKFIENLPEDKRAELNGMRYEEQLRYFFEKHKQGKGGPPWGGPPKRRDGPPRFDKPDRDQPDRDQFDKRRPQKRPSDEAVKSISRSDRSAAAAIRAPL
jgi:anti-sigma-K factor RskA